MDSEILDRVIEANEKLDVLLQWRAGLEERCKAHLEKTEEVRTVLFKNPGGLVQNVNTLLQCKNNLKSAGDRWSGFWIGLLRTLATAAIIAVTAWLLSLYQGQHKTAEAPISQPTASQAH